MKIRDLQPGTRFRYPELGKTAVLLHLGPSGARVAFDGATRQVSFTPKAGDVELDEVSFEAPGRPVLVSDYSDVEVVL